MRPFKGLTMCNDLVSCNLACEEKLTSPYKKCKMTSSVKREDYKFKAPSRFLKGHYKWEGSYNDK